MSAHALGEWGGEAVIETGHRVALLLSSKRNPKGKIKAPFGSDMVCFLKRCQEARDQTQLHRSNPEPSSAWPMPWGAFCFPFGKQETEGAQNGGGGEGGC